MLRDKQGRLSGKRIAVLTVTALMLVFIFVQSVLPKSLSSKESSWFTEKVLNPVFRRLGLKPVTNSRVRKAAHVMEFAALSLLLALCFEGDPFKSVGTGFVAAFLDESVQIFSKRGASVTDIWIDLFGVAVGTLLGIMLWKAIDRKHSKQKKPGEAQTEPEE